MKGFTKKIWSWVGWHLFFALLSLGCSSAPEIKQDPAQASAQEEDLGLLEPLTEKNVLEPSAADGTETITTQNIIPKTAAVALGEEASALLAAAAQIGDQNPAAALEKVNQALASNPRCFQCHYDAGVLWEYQGNWEQASASYQKSLEIHPAHLQTVINLSNLWTRRNQFSKALEVVSTAARTAPLDLELRNQLVSVLLAANRLEDAEKQAKGVLLSDERNVTAMIQLAHVYHLRSKNELAFRILTKAKEFDPSNARIFGLLGFVNLALEQRSAAIGAFRKAVELDPRLSEARNNLAVVYMQAHDYASAIEQLRQAVAHAPHFFEAYLNLGNALRGDKHFKEAEQAYKKAVQMKQDDLRPVFNLAILYLDDAVPEYTKIQRYELAADYLKRFQDRGGRHEKLGEYQAEVNTRLEREKKAELRRQKNEAEKLKREKEAAEEKTKAKEKAKPIGSKIGGGKEIEISPTGDKVEAGSKLGQDEK